MNVLIAAKNQQATETLSRFLDGIDCEILTATDGMTACSIDLKRFDVIFISVPLSNESGMELFAEIRKRTNAHMFLLIKDELAEAAAKKLAPIGGYVISKPLFKGALSQAIRFCELNLANEARLRAEVEELNRKLEEQKVITRAKLILIGRGMSEEEAHKHIQQTAMNLRVTQLEVAEEIIKTA